MKFSEKCKEIFNEWMLDFQASPFKSHESELIVKQLKRAESGEFCNMNIVSQIAAHAHGNTQPPFNDDIRDESLIVLNEIKTRYKFQFFDGFLHLSRRI